MPRKTRAGKAIPETNGPASAPVAQGAQLSEAQQAPVIPMPPLQKPGSVESTLTQTAAPLIVGIGASAGGLEALSDLLTHLPDDTNMAFVIVQHLAPSHESTMTELLGRRTHMKVQQVRDDMQIEPNCVYVIPPNYDLGVLHGTLQLFQRRETQRPHLPVDHFLSSLAQDQKDRAIGVVLSGSGSDGAIGLTAIKAEGGITIAQDPVTAQYDGMPRSAMAAGCVDFVRSPDGIARELAQIAAHPYVRRKPPEDKLADAALSKIFFLLRRATGHDFSGYKRSTIIRRINRRMVVHTLNRIDDYVYLLEQSPREIDELFHDVLINVTDFFRDPEAFEAVKTFVLPRLMEHRNPSDPLRIWVPGCSTGEEAYTLAMIVIEYLGRDWSTRTVQIFASDIDNKAIEKARAGFYPESIQAHVSDERLRRFFVAKPGGFQINKAVRDLCVFSTQNVAQDPPFSRIDLVSCRNLLIYLDPPLQRKVLARLHFALKPQGFMLLGSSETVGGLDDLFALTDRPHKIYAKQPAQVHLRDLTAVQEHGTAEAPKAERQRSSAPREPPRIIRIARNLQQEAEQLLIRNYGPPTVIIDEAMNIVGFSGETGPYVAPSSGAASLALLKIVHPGLGPSTRAAVLRAIRQKSTVRTNLVRFRRAGESETVNIVVTPLQSSSAPDQYYAVVFEAAEKRASGERAIAAPKKQTSKDRRLEELGRELEVSQSQTQNLVSDYSNAIEQLQSANEELQSSTEEMQSTNEELESAKEELQSTNEELATVNEELENRNHELTEVNNDLTNLVTSIDLPLVMLSEDLRIRRFTPTAGKLLNFIEPDVGRPISDIRPNIEVPNLPRVVAQVMDTLVSAAIEIEDSQGRWYSVRIRPYKTSENRIAGVVIIFIDITEIRSLESLRRLAIVVRDSNDAVLMYDLQGNIVAWNPKAERLYGYSEAEALRMKVQQLIPRETQDAHEQLVQRLVRGELVQPLETLRITKDGRTIPVWLTASLVVGSDGKPTGVATTERDMKGNHAR
ncbi:MAG TPA: chemotaxis protein CheB [Steroidobacteraceae bacterium]|nr:chemotaxis protein CheB [Steroidobacteraceae bacterium]